MIKVEVSTAILLYFGSMLLFFLGLWLIHHLKNRKKTTYIPLKTLSSCEYCQFTYLVPLDKNLSKCSQCGAWNKKIND